MGKNLIGKTLIDLEHEVKHHWRNYVYVNDKMPTALDLVELTGLPMAWIKGICEKVGYELRYEKKI